MISDLLCIAGGRLGSELVSPSQFGGSTSKIKGAKLEISYDYSGKY
jgi:hypothetical protein